MEELIRAGIQGFTGGNHIFSKREFSNEALEKYAAVLVRPVNISSIYSGKAQAVFETTKGKVLLGNFLGQVFMENQFPEIVGPPFASVSEWLDQHKTEQIKAVLIDFHAEATSEKVAFGYFLDGKVSAVVGTHTHIPTADAKILPGGTAYITDVGMCGAAGSVLGVKKELSLERFLTGKKVAFDIPDDAELAELSYVIINIDENSGKSQDIKPIHQITKIK